MRSSVNLAGSLFAAAATLFAAPVASAELPTRFASPTGLSTGPCLSKATACTLERAIAAAGSVGANVLLASGTYHPTGELLPGDDVSLIGDPANRPLIDFGSFSGHHGLDAGGNLRNLVLKGDSDDSLVLKWDGTTAGFGRADGTMDRVSVIGTGLYPAAAVQYSTVRNSSFIGTRNAVTLEMSGRLIGSTVINLNGDARASAIASTTSWAKLDFAGQIRPVNLFVRNSIARSARGRGILSNNDAGGKTSLDADYVDVNAFPGGEPAIAGGWNPDSTISLGVHVGTADPQLASLSDPFDLGVPASSPVVDAGAPAGTAGVTAADVAGLDLYGKRRVRRGAPDLGAAEFQPAGPKVSEAKAPRRARPGAWLSFSFKVSEAASVVARLQRVRGSKATTVSTLKSRYSSGTLTLRVRLNQGRRKLAKGGYRIAVTATSADGAASTVMYLPLTLG